MIKPPAPLRTPPRTKRRRAVLVVLLAILAASTSALLPQPRFTGLHVDRAAQALGWDFAPLPGVRLGLDADASLSLGGRVGAVIGRSSLVYVRAGYVPPRRRRARASCVRLAFGVEQLGRSGLSRRTEALYRGGDPAAAPAWSTASVAYRL